MGKSLRFVTSFSTLFEYFPGESGTGIVTAIVFLSNGLFPIDIPVKSVQTWEFLVRESKTIPLQSLFLEVFQTFVSTLYDPTQGPDRKLRLKIEHESWSDDNRDTSLSWFIHDLLWTTGRVSRHVLLVIHPWIITNDRSCTYLVQIFTHSICETELL